MKNKRIYITLCILAIFGASCSKLVEIPNSKSQVESHIVFADSTVATSALLGIYFTLGTASNSVHSNFKYVNTYADDFNYTAALARVIEFNQSRLLADNNYNTSLWGSLYSVIYQCNALVQGIENAGLSDVAKRTIKAESVFLRAYAYLYLLGLYDKVPLVLTPNVDQNKSMAQADKAIVYAQIIADLRYAKSNLGASYQGVGKVRANKWAVSALLSRVFLYQERWADAEKEASEVIDSGLFGPLPPLEEVFLSNNKEAVLQLWNANGFLSDAAQFIPASANVVPQYVVSDNLLGAFEPTDLRKQKWMGVNNITSSGKTTAYTYAAKYKNRLANTSRPEFLVVLRLAEQYLIRAEARAKQDLLEEAITDLNVVRARAGLQPKGMLGKAQCILAIQHEKRLELFGEWAHRFLDLKRLGNLDEAMMPLKATWNPLVSKSFPIPKNEILYNNNLMQNYGY